MYIEVDKKAIRFFFISLSFFVIVFLGDKFFGILTLYNFLFLSISFFILGSFSNLLFEKMEILKPYIIGFLSSVSVLILKFFLYNQILYPAGINYVTLNIMLLSLFISFLSGTFFLIPILLLMGFRKKGNSEPFKWGRGLLYDGIFYSTIILLDFDLAYQEKIYFMKPEILLPIFLIAYIASFFYVGITETMGLNLSIPILFFLCILPYLSSADFTQFQYMPYLIIFLNLFSFIVFYIILTEEKDSDKMYTGSVTSSYKNSILASYSISLLWIIISLIFKFPLNSIYFLLVLLPIFTGSFFSDTLHGIRAVKIHNRQSIFERGLAVVGGAGMSDGLWLLVNSILGLNLILLMI